MAEAPRAGRTAGGLTRRAAAIGTLLAGFSPAQGRAATYCRATQEWNGWKVTGEVGALNFGDPRGHGVERPFDLVKGPGAARLERTTGRFTFEGRAHTSEFLLTFVTLPNGRNDLGRNKPQPWRTIEFRLATPSGRVLSETKQWAPNEGLAYVSWLSPFGDELPRVLLPGGVFQGQLLMDGALLMSFTLDARGLPEAMARGKAISDYAYAEFQAGRCQKAPLCFLTTATCDRLGLADDCFELTMLRRYRDRVMRHTAAGRAEIAAYYALAPEVLRRLAPHWTPRRWAALYLGTILPAALLIRCGLGRLAHRLYRGTVRRIAAELAVSP